MSMGRQAILPADAAWVLCAALLVLLMAFGLGLYYAGAVRFKNSISALFQVSGAVVAVGLSWIIVGYSLAFSGDLRWTFLDGVSFLEANPLAPTIPHLTFMFFHMTFAVVAPAIIAGAWMERVNFRTAIVFMVAWSLIVYCPVAHWVWADGGWIRSLGGLDFAGGLVVHTTSGFSGLVAAKVVGRRADFFNLIRSYDNGLVYAGAAFIWLGWFGFNGGSALAMDGIAIHAATTTFIASSSGVAAWVLLDSLRPPYRATLLGASAGLISGLVAITPGAGYIGVGPAFLVGTVAGFTCNLASRAVHRIFKIDDALDVFASHGVGGVIGTLFTGIFASAALTPNRTNGLVFGSADSFRANFIGSIAVAAYSMIATFIILQVLKKVMLLRVSDRVEAEGLDLALHGEQALNLR